MKISTTKEIEKTKKYWKEFYELFDELPVYLRIKLMDSEKMPTKLDIIKAKEDLELENIFEGF